MNPIARRNPTDFDKYREQYMSSLRLQASNNQQNQNANILFKTQGIKQQPSDFRTTTDKTADLEGLKVDLRSWVKSTGICNSNEANEVVQELDESELRDLLRYKDFIQRDFKGKNVPSKVFINYVRAFIAKEEQTKGVEYGLQQATGENILLSHMTILNRLPTTEQLEAFEKLILEGLRKTGTNSRRAKEAFDKAKEVRRNVDIEDITDPSIKAGAEVLRNSALADFPTAADLADVMSNMMLAQQNNDREAYEAAVQIGLQIVGGVNNAQVEDARNIALAKKVSVAPPSGGYEPDEEEEEKKTPFRRSSSQPSSSRRSRSPQTPIRDVTPHPKKSSGRKAHIDDEVSEDADERDFSRHNISRRKQFLEKKGLLPKWTTPSLEVAEIFRKWREQNPVSGQKGKGVKGRGIVFKAVHKHIRAKKPIELSEGFDAPKLYKQLGRYLIGTYHLANNIACIKRPNSLGKSVLNKHISNELVTVLRKLLRKEQPSFDELNNLSADDKETLYKIVKLCVLDISVPKPETESNLEKDIHRFEIVKGEIQAGNDNAKLLKEFKVLLMKLVHAKRVSRQDAHDILIDLAAEGK